MLRPVLALAFLATAHLVQTPDARAQTPDVIIRIDTGEAGAAEYGAADTLHSTEVQVVSERPTPQACFTFNLRLERAPNIALESYVEVEPAVELAASVRDNVLCLEGFKHGQHYSVTLLAGLPAVGGKLAEPERHELEIGNMRPSLAFASSGFLLPRIGNEGLPLRTVNLDEVHVQIARINDRNLINDIRDGRPADYWDYRTAEIVAEDQGEWIWEGELMIDSRPNEPVVTALPIGETIGRLEPGIYLATATAPAKGVLRDEEDLQRTAATQWFVVSDLGLSSLLGEDGALVQVRSLATAEPLSGIEVALLSRNNKELARARSGADGFVRFDPGLVRGRGGDAAAAIYAYGNAGEFSFIGLEGPAIDLSDRGVDGRPIPGPLDAFIYAERGIYRPGETAHVTLLLRDDKARAVTGLPLTVKLSAPDGSEIDAQVLRDAGGGSYWLDVPLPVSARSGMWHVTAHADPDGDAIGGLYFEVRDFVPPRIEFDLTSAAARAERDVPVEVDIAARYLYGAPAAELSGELAVVIRPSDDPYPALPGYRWGLEQDAETAAVQLDPVAFQTDIEGRSLSTFTLDALPDTTLPLEAVIRAAVFDTGGRPVYREMSLPVVDRDLAIGLKPNFDDYVVAVDSVVSFDVVAVDRAGERVAHPGLTWELVKVYQEWAYYQDSFGRWTWEPVERDSPRIAGGTLAIDRNAPATISHQVGSGMYRLEVFDLETGAATSVEFYAGWWGGTPGVAAAPDQVSVSLDKASYRPGESARVFVQPPFDADVVLTVVDNDARQVVHHRVPMAGDTIELPVPADAAAGVYVVATAFAPANPERSELPQRAIGAAWLAIDPALRRLDVALEAPEKLLPQQRAVIPVTVAGAAAGEEVFLTLAAVDDGVLQLTDYDAPDPLDHYLGKRRLGVDIRDVYGDLIDPAGARAGRVRSGGDDSPRSRQLTNLPKRNTRILSLYSGIVRVDVDGRAAIPLNIPEFNGRVRIMAVAWSAERVGHAERTAIVRAPVVADLSLPLFMAPQDRADLVLSLTNMDAAEGEYAIALTAEGAVGLEGATNAAATLKRGAQHRMAVSLRAGTPGAGRLKLALTGPDGFRLDRVWTLDVRPENPVDVNRLMAALPPGQTFTLDGAAAEGMFRDSAVLNLTVSSVPSFDLPGLAGALARDPYYWTERVVSRGVPYLYFPEAAERAGLGDADKRREQLESVVTNLLGWQVARGSFAPSWLYWDERKEEWLTCYVLDFMTRAREQGARVPELGYSSGLRWLSRYVAQDDGSGHGLAVQAYAYYVLARSNNMDAGRVRRFFEARRDQLPTSLAFAQIGATLARLGDLEAAARAFDAIGDGPELLTLVGGPHGGGSPYDYATELRERAAVLAMMAESGVVDRQRVLREAAALARDVAEAGQMSAQEMAWLLYLARSLEPWEQPLTITVDGKALEQGRQRHVARFGAGAQEKLATIGNDGQEPVYISVSAVGNPVGELPAVEHGITIERRIVDRFGHAVDLHAIRQNDLLVVIIEGWRFSGEGGQTTVVDMLPAGFEIDSVQLTVGEEGDYPWIDQLSELDRAEPREDRYVALADVPQYTWAENGFFRMAYLVRAVTPGEFVLPGVYVEDTFQPTIFARGPAARIRIGTN